MQPCYEVHPILGGRADVATRKGNTWDRYIHSQLGDTGAAGTHTGRRSAMMAWISVVVNRFFMMPGVGEGDF